MASIVATLLGWLNTASMTPMVGTLSKAGQLAEAAELALPKRWRSRKLYAAVAVLTLVQFLDLPPKWQLMGDLLGAALFVAPEAVRDIVAAWRSGPSSREGLPTSSVPGTAERADVPG